MLHEGLYKNRPTRGRAHTTSTAGLRPASRPTPDRSGGRQRELVRTPTPSRPRSDASIPAGSRSRRAVLLRNGRRGSRLPDGPHDQALFVVGEQEGIHAALLRQRSQQQIRFLPLEHLTADEDRLVGLPVRYGGTTRKSGSTRRNTQPSSSNRCSGRVSPRSPRKWPDRPS